jgi:MerR family transcriptional regulator, light-induced transcriptional regulator
MRIEGAFRIGELSRRTGVSPELLRAWERRYGLLKPSRSPGGLRLYTNDDLARIRRMQRHLADGFAAAEAAALAVQASAGNAAVSPAFDAAAARRELAEALERFDEPRAQAILDRLLVVATVDTFLQLVVLPYLRDLGDRWERGEATVGQEHFATGVLRGRLLALSRGWGNALGPAALLACAPGEQHDLGLIAFGLALHARGWRITCLGTDTPLPTLADAADTLEPTLIVVSATTREHFTDAAEEIRRLAGHHRLAVAGNGARALKDEDLGAALVLRDDPLAAADRVAAEWST